MKTNKSNMDKNKKIADFKIQKSAKDKIIEIIQNEKNWSSDVFLRIMIDIGGCAGMRYHIILDDYISDNDLVSKYKKRPILVIDEYSMTYLKNGTLKYEENLDGAGFIIDNPNATGSCSCNSSFSCGSN
jgi:iron-sulfur cluster assembly protein